MQKDLQNATEQLSQGLNDMYESDRSKNLMSLVNRQVDEINRRGNIMMKMEESIKLQQENIQRLLEQNKHLELMVEDMKLERQKLLEEIVDLKSKKKRIVKTRLKKKEKVGDATEAA